MKERLLEMIIWGEQEENGFAIQMQVRGTRPRSFTLTKQDEYEVLFAVVKAIAIRFDIVSGAVSTMEDGKGDPWKIDP